MPRAPRKPARPRAARGAVPGPAEDSRARIVAAARRAFADRGYEGASTREIAAAAGANQGLITYHFRSKEKLWKAAVDSMFADLDRELAEAAPLLAQGDVRERLGTLLDRLVHFVAHHPDQMRLMVQEGKHDGARMKWLVDRHLRRFYELFEAIAREAQTEGLLPARIPVAHLYYILIGAASTIFTAAPECKRLTGRDPARPEAIAAHAAAILELLIRTPA